MSARPQPQRSADAPTADVRPYAILERLGQEADLAGFPDPPLDQQAFRTLLGPKHGDKQEAPLS